jgi:hypothetical protein
MSVPDPVLTASIYTAAGLDDLIHSAIAPFWNGMRRCNPAREWSMWLVRYGLRGVHLKVRLHGPAEEREAVRALLEHAVRAHLPAPPAHAAAIAKAAEPEPPPIDAEDHDEGACPEGTLLWTHYRRSPVSLGPAPHLRSDRYATLLTTCLSRAADIVLAAFDGCAPPAAERQRILLKSLIAGLGAAGFLHASRSDYLAYHRDWLLRFALPDEGRAAETRAGLDQHVDRMGEGLEQIRRVAEAQWRPDGAAAAGDDAQAAWRGAIGELCAWLEPFDTADGFHTDPFALEPMMPPVFKVFHGMANQLGVPMLQEALVHHILLRATRGSGVPVPA